MFKKVLSFMLALAMLATLVVVPVSAENEGVLVFEEDFTDATASIARFEQYGPNTNGAGGSFEAKQFWATKDTCGNALKFNNAADGSVRDFTKDMPRAAIKGSNWSDVRIEVDYTTQDAGKNSFVMLRMDENYSGVAVNLGSATNNTLVNGAYQIVDGVSEGKFFTAVNDASYNSWNILQYANLHAVIELIGTTLTSKIYSGENLISTNVVENLVTPKSGKVVFAVNNSAHNTFDNIKVYDLNATVAPEVEMTPADGSTNVAVDTDVVLTYSDDVADDVVNAITVSPEVAFTKNFDGKIVTLSFTNGLEYNTTYTVTSGDFSASFTTEIDMENILFMEDFTDAAASIARFEQYGPNANGAGGSFEAKPFWATKDTCGNALKFNNTADGNVRDFTKDMPRAAIKDSNWSDVRVEFDYTTQDTAKNSFVMLRMDDNYSGVAVNLGAAQNNTLINGAYQIVDGVSEGKFFAEVNNASYNNWSVLQYANLHAVIEIKGTTLTSKIYNGENLISTNVVENLVTPSSGKVVFAVNHSAHNTFDNIVVTDISGKSADTPLSITPADGAENVSVLADAVLTYKKDVTDEFVEAVSISPAVEYRTVVDGKTLKLSFADALDYDTTYTITAGDATATFTTEALSNDVIFSEDFTDATASLAKFEQYGPALEGYPIVVDNYSQSSNVLHFDDLNGGWNALPQGATIYDFTTGAPRAAIKDLQLSDLKLEFDYSTGPGHRSSVFLRMNNDANGYHGIQIDLGAETNPDKGTNGDIINGYNPISNSTKADGGIYAGNIPKGWYTINSYALDYHCEIEIEGTTLTAKVYQKDTLLSTNTVDNLPYTNAGSIVFASNYVPNTFDNIKITPLGLSFTPDKIKNVQDVVSITFDEPLANTNKWDELIEVKDADGNAVDFSTALNINTGKQVKITLADPRDGEYTITVKKGVEAQLGSTTQSDKTFKVLVTMPYSITDFAIGNLVAGSKVSAEATLTQAVADEQDYTLVLAIYTNEGRLYDVVYEPVTLYDVADSHDFSVTSDLALPSDITGYTAGAWFIDNLTNIKPMSGKITK